MVWYGMVWMMFQMKKEVRILVRVTVGYVVVVQVGEGQQLPGQELAHSAENASEEANGRSVWLCDE